MKGMDLLKICDKNNFFKSKELRDQAFSEIKDSWEFTEVIEYLTKNKMLNFEGWYYLHENCYTEKTVFSP